MRTPWTSRAPGPPTTPPGLPAGGGATADGGSADSGSADSGSADGGSADRDRAWRRARRRAARAHHPDLGGDAAALEAALAAVDAAFGRAPHPAPPPRVRTTLRSRATRGLHRSLLARRRRSRARRSTGRVV